ncbi:crotonase/enoyl-CoA hydratase family protein [Neogemmobacter tilapiae]|uniref:Enoyl-CoA hydratase n=1 Tax=Neogemmobacter tilapiae TaxID=875041 RepID=A0A918TLD2_9RHOB|nr:crotonase/enoyl-CoA hydratase family protein [Gemmobacter tilapiae]GHC53260.1 enoyl-CoA hydratase [Gemmobacter tilapiae]
MKELVCIDREEGLAMLTLNRPEKLNALDYALIDRLLALLDLLETDAAVRAIILTGAGERAFSAGGDIWEFSASVGQGPEAALRDFVARGQRLTARIESYRKPIIVAVNGLAYGGGCEITEAAPLAVASRTARFAKPEIRLGMPPTFGGTQRLPRLAGRKRAMELLLTGESFSAERALALGLVNHVVEPVQLLPAARHLARQILAHSPLAVGAVLGAVTRGINLSIAEGLAVEAGEFARMVPTDDLREGLAAWRERRGAQYSGLWPGQVAPLSEGI